MEIQAINFEELRKYESFSSVAEMDKSIYEYIEFIRFDVPQSVIDVLLYLGRASLRCVGLSFMKQATIAKGTGYSRKTINKALKMLEAFGIVDSVRTKTKAGRPSVKIMRILPFCLEVLHQRVTSYQVDEANGSNGLTLIEDFEPIIYESKKHLKEEDKKAANKDNIDNMSINELDSSFIPSTIVDKDFIQTARPFFCSAKIFKLWGIVKNVMKQAKLEAVTNDVIESVKESFKTTVFMYKANRIRSSFENYFFGVLSSMLGAAKRREVMSNGGGIFYNWLEE
ncbi:UNVERIFIED_ORG: biotin operon repressor [Bacillus sp. B2I3]|nr:biotin operon repressor [Bacillus sp. B2I3]